MKSSFLRVFSGLAFRIAALLALALFPIGLIAIYQTDRIERETARSDEASLLAITAEAATSEKGLILEAFGSLTALVSAVQLVRKEPIACNAIFSNFITNNAQFSFAGYISADGILVCGSDGLGMDVSADTAFLEMKADPKPRTVVNMHGKISKTSIIALSKPIMEDGVFQGYVNMSLPHSVMFQSVANLSPLRPFDFVTFNQQGDVLSALQGFEGVLDRLPSDRTLLSFIAKGRLAFSGLSGDGLPRVFAVVPILDNNIYAIGSWPRNENGNHFALPAPTFPALMWLTSFAVAYFAVHWLVIKHIGRLGRDMDSFMRTGHFSPSEPGYGMPAEMREIAGSWHKLAETVVRDQAKLEDTIQDKTVLLKEVHHRVKNNLQLISSIVSLKTRTAATPEARLALKEVQMRVMSMALVHRALYETSTEGRVRADELLSGIVQRTIDTGMDTNLPMNLVQSYDPVTLYPDQALPISMLATEAITNALKYIGQPPGVAPTLNVRLGLVTNSTAYFEVANSKGNQSGSSNQAKGTGLGNALITAFAQQAGGTLAITDEPHLYCLRFDFPIVAFHPEPVDATINLPGQPL